MKIAVFVDFDGTVATEDTTDRILEHFADPAWREIESDWVAGRIGSRECMARQIDCVRASLDDIEEFARNAVIDPGFHGFVVFCRNNGIDLAVVSDGLDRIAQIALTRAGIEVDLISNHFEWLGGDRWRLSFPFARGDCRSSAGNCKCAALAKKSDTFRILIGDGQSDICAASVADLVLARDRLAAHCDNVGISYVPLKDFTSATRLLEEWIKVRLRERAAGASEVPIHASAG